MPPIIAAPAMKWSQSAEQLGHELDVASVALDEPVARVVVVGLRAPCPYFEWLSMPTTVVARGRAAPRRRSRR